MVRNGGVYVGKGVCLWCRSEMTNGSNFRPTAVVLRVIIRIRIEILVVRIIVTVIKKKEQ